MIIPEDFDDYEELLIERKKKQHDAALSRHPNPQDPDYPGDWPDEEDS